MIFSLILDRLAYVCSVCKIWEVSGIGNNTGGAKDTSSPTPSLHVEEQKTEVPHTPSIPLCRYSVHCSFLPLSLSTLSLPQSPPTVSAPCYGNSSTFLLGRAHPRVLNPHFSLPHSPFSPSFPSPSLRLVALPSLRLLVIANVPSSSSSHPHRQSSNLTIWTRLLATSLLSDSCHINGR